MTTAREGEPMADDNSSEVARLLQAVLEAFPPGATTRDARARRAIAAARQALVNGADWEAAVRVAQDAAEQPG